MKTPDQIAQECAEKMPFVPHAYAVETIAAAIREATELVRHLNGVLIVDLQACQEENEQLRAERARLAAEVERLNSEAKITFYDTKDRETIDQLRAALDVAEGALKRAKTQLGIFRRYCVQEEFSAQQSSITKALSQVHQALARIAALKDNSAKTTN